MATGFSISTLSRLESGKRRPTLELLIPLARIYDVPLDELVGAPATGDPRLHMRPRTYRGRAIVPLTRYPGGLQVYKQVFHGNPAEPDPEPLSHEGYLWFCVLSGKLRLVLGSRISYWAQARSPSSTPTYRTGSAVRTAARWRSSTCSAPRANAPTRRPAPPPHP